APAVPKFSSVMPCFLKMPAFWPRTGAWPLQISSCPIATLKASCADAGDAAATATAVGSSAKRGLIASFPLPFPSASPHRSAHRLLADLRAFALPPDLLRAGAPFADAALRRAVAAAAAGSPPTRPSRSVQYSQVRLVTLGSALSELAIRTSPGVSV